MPVLFSEGKTLEFRGMGDAVDVPHVDPALVAAALVTQMPTDAREPLQVDAVLLRLFEGHLRDRNLPAAHCALKTGTGDQQVVVEGLLDGGWVRLSLPLNRRALFEGHGLPLNMLRDIIY